MQLNVSRLCVCVLAEEGRESKQLTFLHSIVLFCVKSKGKWMDGFVKVFCFLDWISLIVLVLNIIDHQSTAQWDENGRRMVQVK